MDLSLSLLLIKNGSPTCMESTENRVLGSSAALIRWIVEGLSHSSSIFENASAHCIVLSHDGSISLSCRGQRLFQVFDKKYRDLWQHDSLLS